MEGKFTPGPWHVANGVQVRSARDQIAKVWMMRGSEGCANANLIAAAPEILEALQALTNQLADDGYQSGTTYGPLCHAAVRAIAKATGERP